MNLIKINMHDIMITMRVRFT